MKLKRVVIGGVEGGSLSEGVVVVGLLGSSSGPSHDLVNSFGDTWSVETSVETDWQISVTSYCTNMHPGIARHGPQSSRDL